MLTSVHWPWSLSTLLGEEGAADLAMENMGGSLFNYPFLVSGFLVSVSYASLIYLAGGKFGFDTLHGRCNLLQCEKESTNGRYCIPQLVEAVGVGIPSLVLIISYTLVYINLTQTSEDAEAACYFIYILPTSITALLPTSVSNWAFIGTLFSCWYWLIYIVNFFT